MIKLYNSLGRKLEAFKPINKSEVGIYTCGPTLYDWQHIGNLRTFLLTDSLRRALEASGLKVKNVMNITDVEDKIIGQLGGQSLRQFTDRFFTALKHDMQQLNITQPQWVRATDQASIDQMAKLIQKVVDRGLAYETEGSIYLSIDKYSEHYKYGELQPLDISAMRATGRVQADEYDKSSPQDFALWKAHKPGEPSWEITVNGQEFEGRPGWHIECSAMSELELGQQFDIHVGGTDLLFPHHENEIAQSRGANDKLLANYWLHGEMLQVEGQKMSKSLGNIVKLDDVIKKGFDPLALRLLFLQAHYRTQMNFTWQSIAAAEQNLWSIRALADLRWQLHPEAKPHDKNFLTDKQQQILDALQNDLATSKALQILNGVIDDIDGHGNTIHPSQANQFKSFIEFLDQALGLELLSSKDISSEQKKLVDEREKLRQAQDWDGADDIRQQLLKQGLEIKDTASGPVWSRHA